MAADGSSSDGSDAERGQNEQLLYSAFRSTDLYAILGVAADCDATAIKKAYRKSALKYHPDKNQSKGATSKFQALSLAHSILSDPDKRKAYDSSGSVDHADNAEDLAAWEEYWRTLFPAVTVDKINQFSTEYKGSEEERKDVLKAYEEHRGDYSKILSHVMLAEDEDVERFQSIIEDAIASGEAQVQRPSFCDGLNATECAAEQQKRLKALKTSGKTAAARRAKKHAAGDDAALIAAIQGRRGGGAGGSAGGILGSLAAKYGVDMADLEHDPLQGAAKKSHKRRRKGGDSKLKGGAK